MVKAWKRIGPTKLTRVGWRTIITKTFIDARGDELIFDTIDAEDREFVAVIAITKDKKVIVAQQFRPGPEKVFDEMPGGFVDKGEGHEVAMHRELLEETGYKAGKAVYLGGYHKDTYMNAVWHIYLATDCAKVAEPVLGDTEDIELRLISIDELIESAKHDGLTDAVGVLMAYDQLLALRDSK